MATNETRYDTSVSDLTAEIGRLLSGLFRKLKYEPPPRSIHLAESFDIWNLSTKNLQKAIESGKFPSYKTRYRHHQILLNNSAKAYALSQKSPSGMHKVFNVAISKIAERIDDAITHLESKEKDDSRVRLLVIRPFWIYAFWLVDRKRVYLISVSARIRGLKAGQYISTSKLLSILDKNITRFKPKEEPKRKRPRVYW